MQRDPEESTLRTGVHREIEHSGLHRTIHNPKDCAVGFFKDQNVIRADERHAGGLVQVGNDRAHLQVGVNKRGILTIRSDQSVNDERSHRGLQAVKRQRLHSVFHTTGESRRKCSEFQRQTWGVHPNTEVKKYSTTHINDNDQAPGGQALMINVSDFSEPNSALARYTNEPNHRRDGRM
jgi:hypothetical protein